MFSLIWLLCVVVHISTFFDLNKSNSSSSRCIISSTWRSNILFALSWISSFFLLNNSSQIDDVTLQKWGQQADKLTIELQNLIEEPTGRNLFTTQLNLRSLRQQFPYWMSQTKEIDVYQVKVWQNRLDSLDRLLSYGERKTLNAY